MPREYRHIQQYKKEIFELRENELTKRCVGKKLSLTKNKSKISLLGIIEISGSLQPE